MKELRPALLYCLLLCLTVSCVSPKMYNDLKAKKESCDQAQQELKAANLELTTRNTELSAANDEMRTQLFGITADSARLGNDLRKLRLEHQQLQDRFDSMMKDGVNGKTNSEATKQLIRDLQRTQENLQKKEDELRLKEQMLNARRDSLQATSRELASKSIRVNELEHMLGAKDSAVRALKNTLTKALIGYKDQGLTVEQKNGKVYVMLEERLLFASGSIQVDPKGAAALKDLGKAIEKSPDLNLLIEGHTDNVPMHGAGEIKDNWDLSAMRATSVVKILLSSGKLSPARITAAGRSEYAPLDKSNTVEGRKKNRRIEVIITPRLDEIFKVLESN